MGDRRRRNSGRSRGAAVAVRTLAVVVVATAVSLVGAQSAIAHDSLAPRGAGHRWTPNEEWVRRHWIPFDVRTLKRELGLPGQALETYLYDDHHTLATLARARRLHVGELADRLVARWRGQVEKDHLRELQRRTRLILTQGHLSQHMFFHRFHGSYIGRAAPGLLGMPTGERFMPHRLMGRTALQIAREHGVSEATVTAGVVAVFEADHDDGIRFQVASTPTSDWFMRAQIAGLPCWLRRPLPSMDPTNPYGKASELHGRHHRRDWPASAAEQRANEARVERFRRSLKHSCWTRPQAWAWPARRARPNGRSAVCWLRHATARSLDIRASRTRDFRRAGVRADAGL